MCKRLENVLVTMRYATKEDGLAGVRSCRHGTWHNQLGATDKALLLRQLHTGPSCQPIAAPLPPRLLLDQAR